MKEIIERLNIHYARMGEPSWNPNVLKVTYDLHKIAKPYIGNSLILYGHFLRILNYIWTKIAMRVN